MDIIELNGCEPVAVGADEENSIIPQSDPLAEVESESVRRLLQSAMQRFAAVGYHAATTREISFGAGMSPAAVYIHYPSKEAMLFHLSRLGHESVLRAIRDSVEEKRDAGDRVRSVVNALTVWHCRHVALGRVAQYEFEALTEEHHAEITALRRDIQQTMDVEIERGIVSGEFDSSSVRQVSRAILALGIDVIRWYRPDRGLTPEVLARIYADLAIRMLRFQFEY